MIALLKNQKQSSQKSTSHLIFLDISRERRYTLKKEKENQKNKRKKITFNTFWQRKIHIFFENIFGKNYNGTFVLQFFPVAGYWKYNNKTPTSAQICIGLPEALLRPKTYFDVDLYFREVTSIQKKTKVIVKEHFWFTSYKQRDLLTAKLFFKLCISQRYVYNLGRNWKNSVCIAVKNFANL